MRWPAQSSTARTPADSSPHTPVPGSGIADVMGARMAAGRAGWSSDGRRTGQPVHSGRSPPQSVPTWPQAVRARLRSAGSPAPVGTDPGPTTTTTPRRTEGPMTTHTTPSTHRAQITLPGQTATPPGPLDMSAMYLMHHAFRRDLDAFVAAVNATPVEDRACWAALAGRWAVFASSSITTTAVRTRVSGRPSSTAWPPTTGGRWWRWRPSTPRSTRCSRPATPGSSPGRASRPRRPGGPGGAPGRRPRTPRRAPAARGDRGHPAAPAAPDQQEWDDLEAEHFRATLPWRRLRVLVPWALEGVPADVRRHLFAGPGGGPHRILWQLTRRGFARRSRLAFRYRDRR